MNSNTNQQTSTEQKHAQMVKALCKDGKEILANLSGLEAHLWHMSSKACSEAGELMDAIGKVVIYRKGIDMVNVIEELGDLEFYMQGLREALYITRDETLQANMTKLAKRYENYQYSDKQAHERKDKA